MKKLTTEDTETKSADILAENIAYLKELLPEAFTEGKVDFEVLKQLLGGAVDERDEKYGLNWHGKRRARQLALTPSTGTLRPCPEESVDWDTTRNLMIEGDNLEVLKLLQKSYAGKVKLIYIDPPYNTGKDFVYPDDFQDNIKNYLMLTGQVDSDGRKISSNTEASGRFHTDWLNMMYPRLKLARNVLREDGVIFVSIADDEIHNLRSAMDEVFGPENFIATVIWHKMDGPKNTAMHFSEDHDYVLVFAKEAESWRPIGLERTEEMIARYKNPDNDPRGDWLLSDLAARNFYAQGRYPITTKSGKVIPGPPAGSYWRVSREKFDALDRDNRIWWGDSGDNRPGIKRFLSEVRQGVVPQTYWPWKVVGSTRNAKQELSQIMGATSGEDLFITPKPTKLVERMLQIGTNPGDGDIVLDFFGGSGTTGHAALLANAKDNGNRRFILVQFPEPTGDAKYPTIAALTEERLRRAGKRILEENPMFTGDLGFRVFKLGSSNIRAWEPDRENLPQTLAASVEHLKTDRTQPVTTRASRGGTLGFAPSRKRPIIRDKQNARAMTQDIAGQILARIYGNGRGKAFTPKDFLDLASHETARKALGRLAEQGTIRRLMRGVYDYPAFSTFLNAPASPDPDAIARALARARGWTILPSGETALNLLGLSTQVPAQWQYFSDGPSKTYEWAGGTLIFKHRANKETTVISPKTALLVQALKTLGQDRIGEPVMATLRAKFDKKELDRAVREARYATSWVYEIIKRLAAEKEPRHA